MGRALHLLRRLSPPLAFYPLSLESAEAAAVAMATRHPGSQYGLTLPGPMPWLGRGRQHPLAAALAPAASSQPTTMPAPSGRPARQARSTAIPLPNFGSSQLSLPVYGTAPPAQHAARPVAAHQPAASMRPPPRASQLPASQPQGFHWSQRSQLDNIMLGTQLLPEEEEEQGVGDNVATLEVGSAPAADDRYGAAVGPSQPEVSRPPRAAAPAQTMATAARLLVGQLQNTVKPVDDQPALAGLADKLEEMSGKQSALEASLDKVKGDLANHSTALEGIGATCAQLLQAVQTIGGTSDGIAARLQQLLAKPPPAVTGDMATQTSPQLAVTAQPGSAARAPPAQPSIEILQTFSQRRPFATAPLLPAVPPAAAVLLPPRGLSAGAAAAAAKPTTMPTTTPTTSPGSAAATAAAAPAHVAAQPRKRQQPTAAVAPTEAPASAGKEAGKPSSTAKRRQPKRAPQPAAAAKLKPASQPAAAAKSKPTPQPAAAAKTKPAPQPAAAAKPQGRFSRKRPLESSSQQTVLQPPRPSKQQRAVAEALFDSLFDDEQENGAAVVAPAAQPPAKPAAVAAAPARSGRGQPDLAAKVQARLQKHRARFARRRTASQRQMEDEE